MLGFDGDSLSSELAGYLSRGLAGVVLYQRNFKSAEGLRELALEIRQAAGRPVLIGIDQEGGTRFALREPFTAWPSAAELGRLGDDDSVEKVAHAAGVARVYAFSTLEGLAQGLDDMIRVPGHAFAVLDVAPLGRHPPSPPLDGPEVKFRFGRYLERTGGPPVFDTPLVPK